jgi:hypothetical protein
VVPASDQAERPASCDAGARARARRQGLPPGTGRGVGARITRSGVAVPRAVGGTLRFFLMTQARVR